MSGNLTREKFDRWIQSIYEAKTDIMLIGNAENLWAAIEADREAIGAETRGELLKNHFKLSEIQAVLTEVDGRYTRVDLRVRRPPKKRVPVDMNILARHVCSSYGIHEREVIKLSDDTIRDLAKNRGYFLEVEE